MATRAAVRVIAPPQAADGQPQHLLQRALMRMKQTVCGLAGHDYLVHTTGKRLFLQCTSCGHETPGWRVDPD